MDSICCHYNKLSFQKNITTSKNLKASEYFKTFTSESTVVLIRVLNTEELNVKTCWKTYIIQSADILKKKIRYSDCVYCVRPGHQSLLHLHFIHDLYSVLIMES